MSRKSKHPPKQKSHTLFYVRQAVALWPSFEAVSVFGVNRLPKSVSGSCGALLAFTTRKAFNKQYPNEEPFIFHAKAA